jgi:hypothetical protein
VEGFPKAPDRRSKAKLNAADRSAARRASLLPPPPFPWLTHSQWENSVRDLLRLGSTPCLSGTFEPDTRISFFDNNIRAPTSGVTARLRPR